MNRPLDGVRAENLVADVARLRGRECPGCGRALDGRHVLASIWLGFRDSPRCAPCLADAVGRPAAGFLEEVRAALFRRDCFREAWETILDREPRGVAAGVATGVVSSAAPGPAAPVVVVPPDAPPAAVYDAGDLGCGDLVLELRIRLRALPPGATLAVRALDPGAPLDLPAWCGLTGHALVSARHPDYLIRRKVD
jgi:tRNA 2-thiouridine synthesizing protein A